MTCKICGTLTTNNRTQYCSPTCRHQGQFQSATCIHCNKQFDTRRAKPNQCCSRSCAMQHRDVDALVHKQQQTLLRRYGETHPLRVSKFVSKLKHTNMIRYGTTNPSKSHIIKHKLKQSKKRRDFDRIKLLYEQTLVLNFSFDDFFIGTVETQYSLQCRSCKTVFSSPIHNGVIPRCKLCHPTTHGTSVGQQEVFAFIRSLCPDATNNNRGVLNIGKYDIDIFVPSKRLGVEYDGVYWHSELAGKSPDYHINKTIWSGHRQIRLIHVWEPEWGHKNSIVKSLLSNMLRPDLITAVGARTCTIWEVSPDEARLFFDTNHLQGAISAHITYGLFAADGTLLSCIALGRSRFDKKYDYELLRYATKNYYRVVGGLSRLLFHAKRQLQFSSLVTYADRRWFDGHGYTSCGFRFLEFTSPNYFYFRRGSTILESRQSYQKHKLSKILSVYDSSLTEWENMQQNGYNRIWDCGHCKFVWTEDN